MDFLLSCRYLWIFIDDTNEAVHHFHERRSNALVSRLVDRVPRPVSGRPFVSLLAAEKSSMTTQDYVGKINFLYHEYAYHHRDERNSIAAAEERILERMFTE